MFRKQALSAIKERRGEVECWSHHHKQKLSWKLLLESRQLDFGNEEARPDGKRERESLKPQNEIRH